ncbi:MAG: hypothetical protein KBS61_06560 [Chryseobacterium sp.]|nr:hypothetical protein [Candidatus Chryseobacterium enterohippi]
MAKQFNIALSEWLNDFYTSMNSSAEIRADFNEIIVNLGYDSDIVENHTNLIKDSLTNLVSLYHVINRNPKKFTSLLELLDPDDNE